MLASTVKPRPRNLLMVRAFAGDSTITRALPLVELDFLAMSTEATNRGEPMARNNAASDCVICEQRDPGSSCPGGEFCPCHVSDRGRGKPQWQAPGPSDWRIRDFTTAAESG